MATLKEVAREAGVSTITVSRAFDPDAVIRPDTRKQVLAAAERLGYRPNLVAKALKQRRSRIIGIIIPSLENQFYMEFLKYLEIELNQERYRMLVSFLHPAVNTERDALSLMEGSRVDGLFFSPRGMENQALVERMAKDIQLMQLFTAPYPGIDSLTFRDRKAVQDAIERLLSLGHRRILYLGYPGDGRVMGYWDAFSSHGLPVNSSFVIEEWQEQDLLTKSLKELRPTAVLAVAKQAERAMLSIRDLLWRIPEDISLIAFDDSQWAHILQINAITHDHRQAAKLAARSMLFHLSEENRQLQFPCLDTFYIERSSVDKPPAE